MVEINIMKAFMFLAICGLFAYIAFIPPGPVEGASGQNVKSEPMVRIDLGEMQKNMDSWMEGWGGGASVSDEIEIAVDDQVEELVDETVGPPAQSEKIAEEASSEESEEVVEEVYKPEPIVDEPELLLDAPVEEVEEEAPVEEVNIVEELIGE